jgi:hypothetical protein
MGMSDYEYLNRRHLAQLHTLAKRSADEASWRYGLSRKELEGLCAAIDRFGIDALAVTDRLIFHPVLLPVGGHPPAFTDRPVKILTDAEWEARNKPKGTKK